MDRKGHENSQTTESRSMTAYLESLLGQLEAQQGEKDEEAAEALAVLKEKMAVLAAAERRASSAEQGPSAGEASITPPDDVQIASTLDRLEDRLRDFETQLDSADEPTKRILQQSAELWLGKGGIDMEEDNVNGPIKGILSSSKPR